MDWWKLPKMQSNSRCWTLQFPTSYNYYFFGLEQLTLQQAVQALLLARIAAHFVRSLIHDSAKSLSS